MVPQIVVAAGQQPTNKQFRRNFGTARPDDPRTTYTDWELFARYLQIVLPGQRQCELVAALCWVIDAEVMKGGARMRPASYEQLRDWMTAALRLPARLSERQLRNALRLANEAGVLSWQSGYKFPGLAGRCNTYRLLIREVLQRWGSALVAPGWLDLTGRLFAQVMPIQRRRPATTTKRTTKRDRINLCSSPFPSGISAQNATTKDQSLLVVHPSVSEASQRPMPRPVALTTAYLELLFEAPGGLLEALGHRRLPQGLKRLLERYSEAQAPLPEVIRDALRPLLEVPA